MSAPVGTQGKTQPTDLELALNDSQDFLKRLQQLAAAKEANDASLKSLNLGREVKAAYAEAKHAVELAVSEAATLRAAAERELGAARANAAQVIQAAEARAHSIIAGADQSAASVRDTAESQRKAASDYAVWVKNEADKLRSDAAATKREAEDTKNRLEAEVRSYKNKSDIASDSHARARQMQDELKSKLATLQEAIAKIG